MSVLSQFSVWKKPGNYIYTSFHSINAPFVSSRSLLSSTLLGVIPTVSLRQIYLKDNVSERDILIKVEIEIGAAITRKNDRRNCIDCADAHGTVDE